MTPIELYYNLSNTSLMMLVFMGFMSDYLLLSFNYRMAIFVIFFLVHAFFDHEFYSELKKSYLLQARKQRRRSR